MRPAPARVLRHGQVKRTGRGKAAWSGVRAAIGRQSPFAVPARLRAWAAAEFGAGRMVPWLAVAYGFGDVVYFSAEREPAVWAALTLAALGVLIAIMARRRSFGFPLAAAFAALTVSFAGATLHTAWIAHPVLRHPAWGIGFVEAREEREHNDRIVVRTRTMEGRGLDPALALRREVRASSSIPHGRRLRPAMGAGLACTHRRILRRGDKCRAQCGARDATPTLDDIEEDQ